MRISDGSSVGCSSELPIQDMMRRIMSLFDEYQSKENGKHVTRALKENARQGFWNGALPPIGYRIAAAEQRGAKTKKRLEIDPLHADTIRLIYRLALEGQGDSGQMGVKAIVKHLNAKGIFTRNGGRWHRPGPPRPDPPHLYRRARMGEAPQAQRPALSRRDRHRPCAGYHRAGHLQCRSVTIAGSQPQDRTDRKSVV